jgi:ubiquinone/menaquinone biosynthesis C-methylase UbiE
MSEQVSGHYPIERRAGEIERLELQAAVWGADAEIMLDRIGVGEGWRCLDIGCGPGGITGLLSQRAGRSGRVLGLDMNADFIAHARSRAPANVEFRQGDAFQAELPAGSFDLVHMRFVASTAGDSDRLLREAVRLARPGGIVAFQEPDADTYNCYPPHPAWDRLKGVMIEIFERSGGDVFLAKRLYAVARQLGLEDVQYRPVFHGVRSSDPAAELMPSTMESLRGPVLQLGLLSEAELSTLLAECRAHLRKPDTVTTLYTVAQVWGRKAK